MNHPIYFHVQDLSPSESRERILRLMDRFKASSQRDEWRIPERSQHSVIYDSGRLRMKLPFQLTNIQVKTAVRVSAILNILLELNLNHKTLSKRAIFYKYKKKFKTQNVSDKLIDDVCCLIGATRRCLGITASPKGFVIGSLVIRENGKTFDLQDTQNLGKFICPLMSDFEVVACSAKFILVVEKEAYYSSLVEDKIHKKVDCILITGHGMPDMATRYFLRHLTKQVNIPVLGLVDCDPSGVSILCTYTCGSENSAFDCDNLVTPGIKWLGVRPSDLDKYGLMSAPLYGSKILERLMEKDFLHDKTSWMEELEKMSKEMRRCDLDSLKCETVLQKVAQKDWLNNEVQFASEIQPKGSRYHLEISLGDQKMLNLRVVKSETATIKIPQLELEIFPNAQRESLSTVQWILLRESNELQALQEERKKVDPQTAELIAQYILNLNACATGSSSFTFILDDPAGNSFVEEPLALSQDSEFRIQLYERSRDQQASLGYPIDPTQWDEEVMTFTSTCGACAVSCETRMFVTNIPYFQEGIIMAFTCDACGYYNSELKAGGAIPPKGRKVSVIVKDISDLSRDVIKSDTASVIIPEIDLELTSGTLGGVVTTVEGLVIKISEAFKRVKFIRDSLEEGREDRWHWEDFIARLNKILSVEEPWTLIIDDALANSSIAPACDDIKDDQQLTIEEYERSSEQKEELGLNDMDTSSADAAYNSILLIQQFLVTQIELKAFDRPVAGPSPTTNPESEQRWINLIQNWSTSM